MDGKDIKQQVKTPASNEGYINGVYNFEMKENQVSPGHYSEFETTRCFKIYSTAYQQQVE